MEGIINKEILTSLLTAYWLRPESALWYSAMLSQAKNFGAGDVEKKQCLDFGCMDAINSYILLGGKIPFEFDAFYGMDGKSSIQTKTTLGDDYYDHFNLGDLSFNGTKLSKIFTDGIDWKKSHIKRARLLCAHQNLFLWDKVSSIPIDNLQMDLIWAPNIYWIDDLKGLLKEFNRITKSGGSLITIVPDVKLLSHLIMRHRDGFDNYWLSMFDRGRFENANKSARSKYEWTTFFENEGYSVHSCEGFISPNLISAYEIGFRPMFSPLLNMRALLAKAGSDRLLEVKKIWIDTLICILGPLVECDYFMPEPDDSLWHMYKLVKK